MTLHAHAFDMGWWDALVQSNETTPAQKSDAWFEQRKTRFVGGSSLATILGLNPYDTGLDKLYNDTCSDHERHGIRAERDARSAFVTRQGVAMEPLILERFREGGFMDPGEQVVEINYMASKAFDFLGVSPDGVTCCGRLLEIKYAPRRKIYDGIPPYYYPQVQVGLQVMRELGCPTADFAYFVQVSGTTGQIIVTRVHRSDAWWESVKPALELYNAKVQYIRALSKSLGRDQLEADSRYARAFGTAQSHVTYDLELDVEVLHPDPDPDPVPQSVCESEGESE